MQRTPTNREPTYQFSVGCLMTLRVSTTMQAVPRLLCGVTPLCLGLSDFTRHPQFSQSIQTCPVKFYTIIQ